MKNYLKEEVIRRVGFSCALVVCSILSGQEARACTCDPEVPPRAALQSATAVFLGEATYQETIYKKVSENKGKVSFVAEVLVKFVVEKSWKGAKNKEFIIRTSEEGCGYKFTLGEKYLVYAYGKDILATSGCTRTRSLADARDDLKELGRPRKNAVR